MVFPSVMCNVLTYALHALFTSFVPFGRALVAIDIPPANTHQRTFVFSVSHDSQYERFFSIHVVSG